MLSEMEEQGYYLEQLHLGDLDWLSAYTLQNIGSLCPNLTSLDVSRCSQFDALALEELGNTAPRLRSLDLTGCKGVHSREALARLLAGCGALEQLRLDDLGHLLSELKDNSLVEDVKTSPANTSSAATTTLSAAEEEALQREVAARAGGWIVMGTHHREAASFPQWCLFALALTWLDDHWPREVAEKKKVRTALERQRKEEAKKKKKEKGSGIGNKLQQENDGNNVDDGNDDDTDFADTMSREDGFALALQRLFVVRPLWPDDEDDSDVEDMKKEKEEKEQGEQEQALGEEEKPANRNNDTPQNDFGKRKENHRRHRQRRRLRQKAWDAYQAGTGMIEEAAAWLGKRAEAAAVASSSSFLDSSSLGLFCTRFVQNGKAFLRVPMDSVEVNIYTSKYRTKKHKKKKKGGGDNKAKPLTAMEKIFASADMTKRPLTDDITPVLLHRTLGNRASGGGEEGDYACYLGALRRLLLAPERRRRCRFKQAEARRRRRQELQKSSEPAMTSSSSLNDNGDTTTILSALSRRSLVSLGLASNPLLTADMLCDLGGLRASQARRLENVEQREIRAYEADASSTSSSPRASSLPERWAEYNEWVSAQAGWFDTIRAECTAEKKRFGIKTPSAVDTSGPNKAVAKQHLSLADKMKRVYAGRSRDAKAYDGGDSGSLPPFANSNSVMSLGGACTTIAKVLVSKMEDDARCDGELRERGKLAAWIDGSPHLETGLQKQRLMNSIMKFRDSNRRVRIFGELAAWLDSGRDPDETWCDIVLDLIARVLSGPTPSDMEDQLSDPSPVLVPLTLVKKALNFILKGSMKHPQDLEPQRQNKAMCRKLSMLAKKSAGSERVGGQEMVDLFGFVDTFQIEWYRAGQKPRPRVHPRVFFGKRYLARTKNEEEGATVAAAAEGKPKKKKSKPGEDAEADAAEMQEWLDRSGRAAAECQADADTLRRAMWDERWKSGFLPDSPALKAPHPCAPRMALMSIDLSFCTSIGDAGLVGVAQLCPELRHVRLVGCVTVGDVGLAALARGCPLVVTLDLSGCVQVGDPGVRAVAHLKQLRNLSLARCRCVSDVGMRFVPRGCPELRRLDLRGCSQPAMSDVACKVVLENAKKLETILLDGCDAMSRLEYGLDLDQMRQRFPAVQIVCSRLAASVTPPENPEQPRKKKKSKILRRFPEPKKPFVPPDPALKFIKAAGKKKTGGGGGKKRRKRKK